MMTDRNHSTTVKPSIRIFLCHASEDRDKVEQLYGKLAEIGFKPWLSSKDLRPGDNWDYEIRKNLGMVDAAIVCLSPRFIDKANDRYVWRELNYVQAIAEQRPSMRIIPVMLEQCDVPASLKHLHCERLTVPEGFRLIAESLNAAELTLQVQNAKARAISRRNFVALTATGLIGSGWLFEKQLSSLCRDERDTIPAYQNLDRIRHLLFPQSSIDVVPPSAHPRIQRNILLNNGVETYGHEYSILTRLQQYFPAKSYEVLDDRWELNDDHSLVCLGSGASNHLTNELVGNLSKPKFVVGNKQEKVQLRYATKVIGGDTVYHLQYGEMFSGTNSAIVCSDGRPIAVPKTTAKRGLIEDYLLVTRIPGKHPGTTATIFSGLHGPGTRAAELLLTDLPAPQIEFITGCLDCKGKSSIPCFQAIFRAWDFEEIDESWVPQKIECVRDPCPPISLRRC